MKAALLLPGMRTGPERPNKIQRGFLTKQESLAWEREVLARITSSFDATFRPSMSFTKTIYDADYAKLLGSRKRASWKERLSPTLQRAHL